MSRQSLPSQSTDFSSWYGEVVRRTGLAEHSLVRGAMVIQPYGYAIWEAVQGALDERIKDTGHENLYFPLFVPSSVLDREAELVEGFAPEVAVVTHGREEARRAARRPADVGSAHRATYARWVQSYRDLPLLYNQWANVVRWELRPRLFLRTTEFLWQEGHTAHETEDEAVGEALRILDEVYADTAERVLAMPVLRGRKSAGERFPGAVDRNDGSRQQLSAGTVAARARELLAAIQRRLLEDARAFRREHTLESPESYEAMREFLAGAGGFAVAPWCGAPTPARSG